MAKRTYAMVVSGESDIDSDADSRLLSVSWMREFQQEDESSALKKAIQASLGQFSDASSDESFEQALKTTKLKKRSKVSSHSVLSDPNKYACIGFTLKACG